MDNKTHETTNASIACSAMSSELAVSLAVSPSYVVSSNHVSFTPSEVSGMCVDEPAAHLWLMLEMDGLCK